MEKDALDHQVAIIGTGFAGMGIAIALDKAGIHDFIMLEKSDDIGGTWRDNRYPGACCDVPSQLYSFSFELNPDWSHRFSPAEEIHAYQQHVMEKYHLRERTRTGFEVDTASYSNEGWTLKSTRNDRLRARYLVSAVGALHIPYKPDFSGIERFEGKLMHSAEWDRSFDYSGKKVIVIGSAASAIQIIPQLAKSASRISVIQRTANYFVPRKDRKISHLEKTIFRKLPFIQRMARWQLYWLADFLFRPNFLLNPSLRKKYVHWMVQKHLHRQVKDPALVRRLTPNYPIGCKRMLLSDDIFPALQQPNVDLVDDGIRQFTRQGLVTASGLELEADLVVLATGFQTTKLLGDMSIEGPGGLTMDKAWAKEIRAHRSVAVKGFPNFFMMYGPNSNLGHSSMIIMLEAQAHYISRLLKHAFASARTCIEVRPEAEAAYNRDIQNALKKTVWSSACDSWYKDGNGSIFSLWPHSTTRFIREMRKAPLEEFEFT
jgi:cation diffusion facilitator CzcD-associated flavoprotein CzcO